MLIGTKKPQLFLEKLLKIEGSTPKNKQCSGTLTSYKESSIPDSNGASKSEECTFFFIEKCLIHLRFGKNGQKILIIR